MKAEIALNRALEGTGVAIDFSGTWINELKSTMVIQQNANTLSGQYTSARSSTGAVATGKVQGSVDGDLISFVVHWNEFQAITAWVGQLDKDQKILDTLWQMTKQVSTGEEWASINAGADQFTRV